MLPFFCSHCSGPKRHVLFKCFWDLCDHLLIKPFHQNVPLISLEATLGLVPLFYTDLSFAYIAAGSRNFARLLAVMVCLQDIDVGL